VLRLVKLRARRQGMLPPPPASQEGSGVPSSSSCSPSTSRLTPSREAAAGDRSSGVRRVGGFVEHSFEPSVEGGVAMPPPIDEGGMSARAPMRAIR
jgi:hypothetical protein